MPNILRFSDIASFITQSYYAGVAAYDEHVKKRARQTEYEQFYNSDAIEAKILRSIHYENQTEFLNNLKLAAQQPGGIAALRLGRENYTVPLAFASHVLDLYKNAPENVEDYPNPDGQDNTDYENYVRDMKALAVMLINLAQYCSLSEFNTAEELGEDTALEMLLKVDVYIFSVALQEVLTGYRQQGHFNSLDAITARDLLHIAVLRNSRIFDMLLNPKVGNIDINHIDEYGNTSLHRLVQIKNINTLQYLNTYISSGADLNILNNAGKSVRDLVLSSGIDKEAFSNHVNNALYWKMIDLVAKAVAGISRGELAAFVRDAVKVWHDCNPEYPNADAAKILKGSLEEVYNRDSVPESTVLYPQNARELLLTKKISKESFENFLSRITRAWYKSNVKNFIVSNSLDRDGVSSLCHGAICYWETSNPRHRDVIEHYFESRLYSYEEGCRYVVCMKLTEEKFAQLLAKHLNYRCTVSDIIDAWDEIKAARAEQAAVTYNTVQLRNLA